jgi:hypothetical protein
MLVLGVAGICGELVKLGSDMSKAAVGRHLSCGKLMLTAGISAVARIALPSLWRGLRGIRDVLARHRGGVRAPKSAEVSGQQGAPLTPWLVRDYGAKELPTLTIEAHHLKLLIDSVVRGTRVDRHAWQ